VETPGITILHDRVNLHDYQPLFDEYRETPLVSISNSQGCPLPEANWQAIVYHGLPGSLQRRPANLDRSRTPEVIRTVNP
jgi:hypothetical protein